eukprot:3308833-Rhodomonas_salina.2
MCSVVDVLGWTSAEREHALRAIGDGHKTRQRQRQRQRQRERQRQRQRQRERQRLGLRLRLRQKGVRERRAGGERACLERGELVDGHAARAQRDRQERPLGGACVRALASLGRSTADGRRREEARSCDAGERCADEVDLHRCKRNQACSPCCRGSGEPEPRNRQRHPTASVVVTEQTRRPTASVVARCNVAWKQ